MAFELFCLALILYHEARGEPRVGQLAVAEVVLNRVQDERYPDTICEVMEQKHNQICHFSFWCDDISDTPQDKDLFKEMREVAWSMFYSFPDLRIVDGATHYHHIDVSPRWAWTLTPVARIDNHVFYRWDQP